MVYIGWGMREWWIWYTHIWSFCALHCAVGLPLLCAVKVEALWSWASNYWLLLELCGFLHFQLRPRHALILLQPCNLLLLLLQKLPLLCDDLLLGGVSVLKLAARWHCAFWTGKAAALTYLLCPLELSSSRCCMLSGHLPWLSGLGHSTRRSLILMHCRGIGGWSAWPVVLSLQR